MLLHNVAAIGTNLIEINNDHDYDDDDDEH
jgi:hypothetical protein